MKKLCIVISFLLIAAPLQAQRVAIQGSMGMGIENAAEQNGAARIVTTGAKFLIRPDGTLLAFQRIPRERELARVNLPDAASSCRIHSRDDSSCALSCSGADVTIHADSVLILRFRRNLDARFQGLFRPAYHAEKDGKWLVMDGDGGFGIYPVANKSVPPPHFSDPRWSIAYHFVRGEEVWLSVFPPRPYNWSRVFEPIDHEGLPLEDVAGSYEGGDPYPSNESIQLAARYCKILVLHAYIWQDAPEALKEKTGKYAGHPQPWLTPKHVPLNMKEFIRVRDEAHKNGMKLVVYLSPYYSHAPDIFAEMKRALDEYQVDGLYFDGISRDFRKSYEIIRRARQILGDDRILYVHCSTDPLGDGRIYCPFIDTYADYILRGEAGVFGLKLNSFLRWTVSGYNISNAIGYWCYYGSNRQQGYDASTPKSGDYFDTVPTLKDIEAALRNHAFIWREGDWSRPQFKADLARFDRDYYGKLELLQNERDRVDRRTH